MTPVRRDPVVHATNEDVLRRSDSARSTTRWGLVALIVVVCAAHGLHAFNRSGFWDGSAILFAEEHHRYVALRKLFLDNGVPVSAYLHQAVALFPSHVLVYRLIDAACLILTGTFVSRILIKLRVVPPLVAVAAGLLSAVMPLSIILFEVSLVAASIFLLSFLAGIDLLLVAPSGPRGPRPVLRFASLSLLALSFFYGTFLFAGLLIVAVSLAGIAAGASSRRRALERLRRWPDAHLLPFVFACARRLWWNPKGRYEGYNSVSWPDLDQWAALFRMPWKYGQRLFAVIWPEGPFGTPQLVATLAAVGGLALIAYLARPRRRLSGVLDEVDRWPWRSRLAALAAGLVAVYISVIPHFLVGRRDLLFVGFISRDHLPAGVPVAATLAILLFAVPRAARLSLFLTVIVTARLVFFHAALARQWLDDELTEEMVVAAVSQSPEIERAGVVVFDETVMRFNHLEWLEFQIALARAFGTETRLAFPTWELARCSSLPACAEAFAPRPDDPLAQIAGARDARGCGLAIKARVERKMGVESTWADYAIGHAGGPELAALADARIRIVTSPIAELTCPQSARLHSGFR